ncbi:MAG: plasmid and phage replicative helicase [Devosia sp.]|nr:plasmid and phage replicative helicase [Devosia sp.]
MTEAQWDPRDYMPFVADAPAAPPLRSSRPHQQQRLRLPVVATPYLWTEPCTIPPREWIYGRHLARKFVSATVAPGGVGKTSLAVVESLAMISGRDLLGMTLPYVGLLRAWYLNLEDPREEVTRQVQAAALRYGLTPDDLGDRLFVDSGREQEFIIAETVGPATLVCRPVVDSMVEQLKTRMIDVLTVDPFVSCHDVSENDNGAMDLVVKEWGRVADSANCAVHLVHHTRKTQADMEVTAESSRGAKALTDGCRSVRAINRMTGEEAERAGVDNRRLYFRTFNDKANLAPPSDRSDWYRLESVHLGNGGVRPGDQLGVVTTWQWPDPFADISVDDLRQVQAAVAAGEWKESVQAKSWVGYAIAEVLELDPDEPVMKARIKSLLKTWIKNGVLAVERRLGLDRHPCPYVVVGEPV